MRYNFLGCKVTITFWFIALITAVLLMEQTETMIWGIIAAMMHELGHIFAMILKGDHIREIKFNLFDIAIVDKTRQNKSYRDDILILFAGPMINFILCVLFYFLYLLTKIEFLLIPMGQNCLLGIFNILPIESLDGGQILYAFLLQRFSPKKSEIIVELVSFVVLLPLAVLGFYLLLQSRYNFTLLLISCYLMAVILLKKNKFY